MKKTPKNHFWNIALFTRFNLPMYVICNWYDGFWSVHRWHHQFEAPRPRVGQKLTTGWHYHQGMYETPKSADVICEQPPPKTHRKKISQKFDFMFLRENFFSKMFNTTIPCNDRFTFQQKHESLPFRCIWRQGCHKNKRWRQAVWISVSWSENVTIYQTKWVCL